MRIVVVVVVAVLIIYYSHTHTQTYQSKNWTVVLSDYLKKNQNKKIS
jgi:hypothetical protein